MRNPKEYLTLLFEFFRFGAFTFGGGWSIVAQMNELYVDKKKVITAEELVDIVSVAKSLPGTMVGNVAMLYGYRAGGLLGGLLAVMGMCMPPMMILIAISFGYDAFRDNYWVSAGMQGVQAAVVPIIAAAAMGLVKGSIKNWFSVVVQAAAVILYLVFNVTVVWLVIFGLVCGLVYGELNERKGGR